MTSPVVGKSPQQALKQFIQKPTTPSFQHIKEPRIRKIAYMRYWLLDFCLKLRGQRKPLTDKAVAKRFNVSISSAREALDAVCSMGYATHKNAPGKAQASKQEYQLLPPFRPTVRYENRVEGLVAQLACGHVRGFPGGRKPDSQYRCLECLETVTEQVQETYRDRS